MICNPLLTRRNVLRGAALAFAPAAWRHAAAAGYPERAVKIVHAWPGAPVDTAMRYVADKLQLAWTQPVLIDTRPGGSEVIAGNAVVQAAPDGYTLYAGADNNFSTNKYLLSKMPFDPEQDLVPITELFETPFCLIVPGDFPARTLREFAELAKKGSYQYASTGVGGPNHLLMESLSAELGISLLHVPYKVGPQIIQDLVAGRVQAMVAGVNTAAQFVPSGKLKALALSGARRHKSLPDTPTFAEAGYPQIAIESFFGLAAPRGTPPDVIEKIATDVRAILSADEFQQKIGEPFAYTPIGSSPRQFAEFLGRRRAQAQHLIKALGLKPE